MAETLTLDTDLMIARKDAGIGWGGMDEIGRASCRERV